MNADNFPAKLRDMRRECYERGAKGLPMDTYPTLSLQSTPKEVKAIRRVRIKQLCAEIGITTSDDAENGALMIDEFIDLQMRCYLDGLLAHEKRKGTVT